MAHKLVYRAAGASELYDLVEDPRELNNVHGDSKYAHLQQALMEHMIDWLIQTGDVPPLRNDPRPPPKPPNPISWNLADLLQPDPSRQGWGRASRRSQRREASAAAGRLMAVNGVPPFST